MTNVMPCCVLLDRAICLSREFADKYVLDEGWLCCLEFLALVSVFADNNTVMSRVKVLAL